MSNNYWEDEDDDTTTDANYGQQNDNDLVRQLRKADRAKEKRIKELESELVGFKKVQSERTVREILEKVGVKPSAAKYILKYLESDITPESVKDWLRENGDDFGWQPQAASKVSDEERQALSQQDKITQGAITPDRGEDLEMRIDQATSPDELRRILYSE